MKQKQFIIIIALFILVAQLNGAVGSWHTYLAYTDVQKIAQTQNKVFALSSGSLFSVDKRDASVETYSKVTGLNDNNISLIEYNEELQILFVVYQNSNIDLIANSGLFNLPDLSKKTIAGSKKINHVFFKSDIAYISTDFGILKVDVKKREFSDTYIIGENATNVVVKGTTAWGDSLYAITDNRIYAAALTDNLSDYQHWNPQTNLPESEEQNISVLSFQDQLFLLKASGNLYVKSDQSTNDWTVFKSDILSANLSQNRLNLTSTNSDIYSYSSIDESSAFISPVQPAMCVYDAARNKYYVAAYSNGLSIVESPTIYTNLSPNGPALNDPFTMKFVGQKLYVTTSGTWVSGTGKEDIPGAVMIYDGFGWINITDAQIPPLDGSFISVLDIAVDPDDPSHFFVGTWHKALYEFRNNTFYERYNSENSVIQSASGSDMYQIVDGLVFDENKNLWMTQSAVSDAIKVLKSDGTWKSFYFPAFTSKYTIQKMMIDKNGFKWINVPRSGQGVFIFDDNGTIDDISDDRSKFIPTIISTFYDQDERSFTSSSFRCIVEDNSTPKKIWIGTANGPIIISNTENVFNTVNVKCTRIKIPRNDGTNLADYLLENESINDIAVDGANRKWLATKTSGVFLVSENGTETIHHFTTANSPILSDNVLSVAINSNTGEVFFGTDQGIISYAGDATTGGNVFANAYAYPNPVRENYEGVISIVGLIENSNVKITDVAGNLIYEATSNGGMLTWDGKNIHGQRVSTGVYLALCSTPDNEQSTVVKILIMNNK